MSNTLRSSLIVLSAILVGALLFYAGLTAGANPWAESRNWMGNNFGGGMMFGNYGGSDNNFQWGPTGMTEPIMGGMMGAGFGSYSGGDPITLAEAEQALQGYLAALGNEDLVVGEIMIFENHAYAQILEESSGVGAMEVLVDPATLSVFPEYGPNMMWNQKYGMMGGYGMMGMGSMMGGFNMMGNFAGTYSSANLSGEMDIDAEQAREAAQRYLDRYSPGQVADEHADPFYGYYTLHIVEDGETVGMLSVNGYSGQVFPHTWHGELLEMSGE